MLDRAGQQLAPEIDGEQFAIGGDAIVASHGGQGLVSRRAAPSLSQPAQALCGHDLHESFSTASLGLIQLS